MPQISLSAYDLHDLPSLSVTPAFADVYASMDFRTSDGVLVAAGNPNNLNDPKQRLTVSMVGSVLRIGAGSLYSTIDSIDHPEVTYAVVFRTATGAKVLAPW